MFQFNHDLRLLTIKRPHMIQSVQLHLCKTIHCGLEKIYSIITHEMYILAASFEGLINSSDFIRGDTKYTKKTEHFNLSFFRNNWQCQ